MCYTVLFFEEGLVVSFSSSVMEEVGLISFTWKLACCVTRFIITYLTSYSSSNYLLSLLIELLLSSLKIRELFEFTWTYIESPLKLLIDTWDLMAVDSC